MTRSMTLEDLWAVRRVGAPAAHPDGSVIVVPVTTFSMDENKGTTRLHRVPTDGGDPVPLTADGINSGNPALSPDGRQLAMVRDVPDGKPQLAVMPLDGGEARVLTDMPLGVTDPRWFPDGSRIAFVSGVYGDAPGLEDTRKRQQEREEDKVQAHITEKRVYRFWDSWLTDGVVPHIFVLELESGKVTDLIPDSKRWFEFMDPTGQYDISPDGVEIVFAADGSEPPHSPTHWEIFTVPTAGGATRQITPETLAENMRPRYSPDGSTIVYGLQRELDFYADKVRVVAYDRASGEHTALTEDWDRSAAGWEFVPGTAELRLLAEDDARTGIFSMSPEPGSPERLVLGATYSGLTPLADGSMLALRTTISEPAELVRMGVDGKETALTAFNRELMADIDLGTVEEIRYPGTDGREIQAYVVKPPGFDAAKQYPMVEVLHGGPHGIIGDFFHYRWNLHLLASPGYVVVAPNFHGSTSWGQEFAGSILGSWGEQPYTDAMACVDTMLETGYIDETKMAATGASYGGYLVTWIAGHTDRFACIVNHAGVADTLAEYASDVTYGRARSMGGEPWDDLDGLDRMNPIRFARGFKTPMLVVHGEKDYRVPVTQGLETYNILQAMGVPSRLIYFPDENHWVLKPQNSRLWHREVFAWLDRWFKKRV